jgi:Ca2+-binding EF-hand superfamily protein
VSGWGRPCAVTDTNRYADSFAIIDTDGDGLISSAELVQLMRAMGDDVTDEAAATAVEIMDVDGDGKVSLEEFARYQSAHGA